MIACSFLGYQSAHLKCHTPFLLTFFGFSLSNTSLPCTLANTSVNFGNAIFFKSSLNVRGVFRTVSEATDIAFIYKNFLTNNNANILSRIVFLLVFHFDTTSTFVAFRNAFILANHFANQFIEKP